MAERRARRWVRRAWKGRTVRVPSNCYLVEMKVLDPPEPIRLPPAPGGA